MMVELDYRILLSLVLVGVILFVGCIGEPEVVCNKPYIRVGTECCLDQNDNGICDEDEVVTTTIIATTTTIQPKPQTACTGFSQVRPIGHKADGSTGEMMLVMTNGAGVKIKLDDVIVSVFDTSCTGGHSPATLPELRAGQNTPVNVSGCTFPSIGDYYKAEIIVEYTNLVSGITHKSVGECHGSVE